MKKNKKILLIAITIIIIILIIVFAIIIINNNIKDKLPQNYMQENEFGEIHNTSPKIIEEEEHELIAISNIDVMKVSEDNYVYSATATNNRTTKLEYEDFVMTFYDDKENELAIVEVILQNLEPGESQGIIGSTSTDISSAYDYKIRTFTGNMK